MWDLLRRLNRFDDSAGQTGAAVPGGLGAKIIRPFVDHHRASHHFFRAEPVSVHLHQSGALTGGEQRGQIAAVPGMGDVVGIVMSACGRKGHVAPRRAASVGMDMKAQKAGNGQSYRPGNDQRPAPVGAEQDLAPQVWMGLVAPELSPGGGAGQGNRMVHGADLLSHAYARQ